MGEGDWAGLRYKDMKGTNFRRFGLSHSGNNMPRELLLSESESGRDQCINLFVIKFRVGGAYQNPQFLFFPFHASK